MPGSGTIVIERKISHGIGGAGNFRLPRALGRTSEVILPVSSSPASGTANHRCSIWSVQVTSPGSSPTRGWASILSIFRQAGVSEPVEPLVGKEEFGEEDLDVGDGVAEEVEHWFGPRQDCAVLL